MEIERHKRGALLLFPCGRLPARGAAARCSECKTLELAYQAAIQEIYAVVNRKFESVGEKLRCLFEKQDIRDKRIESLYAHNKAHRNRAA